MGPVAVLFPGEDLVVVIIKIPSVDIVHISVPIVIDPISRDLIRVHPQGILQIFMRVVDARIDHRDDRIMISVSVRLPCLLQVDIHAGYRLALFHLHKSSQKLRILRRLSERIRIHRILPHLLRCKGTVIEKSPLFRGGRVIRLKLFRGENHKRLPR